MRHRAAIAGFVVSASICACEPRIEPGLANAPSIQRMSRPREAHDVITNGRESCPPEASRDPLPGRFPACEEERADAGSARAAKAP